MDRQESTLADISSGIGGRSQSLSIMSDLLIYYAKNYLVKHSIRKDEIIGVFFKALFTLNVVADTFWWSSAVFEWDAVLIRVVMRSNHINCRCIYYHVTQISKFF